jgi:hypothetical protein
MDKEKDKINELEKKISILKREVKIKDRALREKNIALDAMHYIWCTGCDAGAHRWSENTITIEVVEKAKEMTTRLETWWVNHYNREIDKGNIEMTDEQLLSYVYFRIWNPLKYNTECKVNQIKDETLKNKTYEFLNDILNKVEEYFNIEWRKL